MMEQNVFWLHGVGNAPEIPVGSPVTETEEGSCLELSGANKNDRSIYKRLFLGKGDGRNMPALNNEGLLVEATIGFIDGDRRLVARAPEHRSRGGILLRVSCKGLQFGFPQLAKKRLNLWPGCEGKQPIMSCGHRKQQEKEQLFWILRGEKLYVTDSECACGVLSVTNSGQPVIRSADRDEVIAWLVEKGCYARSHRGITWALENLKVLGARKSVGWLTRRLQQYS